MDSVDDMDLIIALGMAKEGFDWPYCEHALTIGYRGSLTEIIQIIGRATRDSDNKTHAQFTNLIAQPDAADDLVKLSVNNMLKAMPGNVDPEVINKVLIPKIIKVKYPDLSDDELEEVRQHVVVDSVIKNGEIKETGDKRFIRMAGSFVDIDDIHIDLIDLINPFQKAFEILSKSVTTKVLKVIQDHIEASRIRMDFEEARILWPKIQEFIKMYNREPNLKSNDPLERRMAECINYLKEEKRKKAEANG
jgi:hypothetical protein